MEKLRWVEGMWRERGGWGPPSRVPSSLVALARALRRATSCPRPFALPLPPSTFLLNSKLDAFLGFDALVFEGVFDDFHFGDGVGEVDEGLGGVAAGDDGVLHGGAGLEVVEDLVQVEVLVAQGDVEFVEQYHVVAVVLQHALGLFPGGVGGGDVAFAVLGVPGVAFAHDVVVHVGQVAEEGFFAGAERALDELHHADLHAVAKGAGEHAKTGAAFAFAGAGEHQQNALLFVGAGNALVHDFLLGRHALGMAFRGFGIFAHGGSLECFTNYVLRFQYVAQGFHDLIGGGAPGLGLGVDFFQRVNDLFAVQRDVGLGQGCAVACIEGGVPLLVLVAEAHHHQIGLFDQRAGADGVHFGRLVVTPEAIVRLAQVVASGIGGVVVGHRGGEDHVQACGFCAALDLFAPVGVNLAGKVDVKAHGGSLGLGSVCRPIIAHWALWKNLPYLICGDPPPLPVTRWAAVPDR